MYQLYHDSRQSRNFREFLPGIDHRVFTQLEKLITLSRDVPCKRRFAFKRVENLLCALVTVADELVARRFHDTVTKCREKFPISPLRCGLSNARRLVLKLDGKLQT
ncbi:hypothetical protein K0M31_001219 [Melipona bicolor]|uniref:Uncharacterized protein n=1 Tax=Melipona bicolor TaxID=60889 RepID=A0AA40GF60_9HYME|nr:hypothetical protein K0M31_001219 [Melipona bicolor]